MIKKRKEKINWTKIGNLEWSDNLGEMNWYDAKKKCQEIGGRHSQQVAYSSFHDCLTQICFGCKKIRTNIKGENE